MKRLNHKFMAFVMAGVLMACQSETKKNAKTSMDEQKISTETTSTSNKVSESLPSDIFYPTDYRSWTHIKSMILEKGHPLFEKFGGIHHLYANEKAMEGYKNNHQFPDGSIIVFDLLEHIVKDNAINEGNRKVIGIMYKNSSVFSETGGWIFGAFKNQNGERIELDSKAACFSCHLSQKDRDYVFSDYRP